MQTNLVDFLLTSVRWWESEWINFQWLSKDRDSRLKERDSQPNWVNRLCKHNYIIFNLACILNSIQFNVYFFLFFPFQANWFKATQYCRYHGMHLASISSQEENDRLEKHIRDFGKCWLLVFNGKKSRKRVRVSNRPGTKLNWIICFCPKEPIKTSSAAATIPATCNDSNLL